VIDRLRALFTKRSQQTQTSSSHSSPPQETATAAESAYYRPAAEDEAGGGRDKVIALGCEEAFSDALVDYALRLAQRFGCGIEAVSVWPVPKGFPKDKVHLDTLQQDLLQRSSPSAERFRERARQAGVPFQHVVMLGPVDACLIELSEHAKGDTLVVSEPELVPEVEGSAQDGQLPVFALSS